MPAENAPQLDRIKLAKVLPLLGSPIEGEVLAAARRATALLLRSQLSWSDVLETGPSYNRNIRGSGMVADQGIQYNQWLLYPPYGETWTETVRWLQAEKAATAEYERWTLDHLERRLTSSPASSPPLIQPREANFVMQLFRTAVQRGRA